jgi:hypothetical protein
MSLSVYACYSDTSMLASMTHLWATIRGIWNACNELINLAKVGNIEDIRGTDIAVVQAVVVQAVVAVVVVAVGKFRDLHQPRCLPWPLPNATLIGVGDGYYNLTNMAFF